MDIWDTMYEKAKPQFHPEEVSPFVYAHHVVCAIEAENGEIFTGFCIESCSGVLNLCKAPYGAGSGMPCGACREFFYQLNEENEKMEIMEDFEQRKTVTLKELMPNWWGKDRYAEAKAK
ncbi:cytidine deaminase [Lactobacillus iners]|uniref:cytidine deaminase n=1 Tax=Lactobacillus iners TaxID=147802 RepID=UPI002A65A33D|nr:cytidine deaminase [Lactobacillus iners]